jgi:hypothetical protein
MSSECDTGIDHPGKFQQESGGRSAIVGSNEDPARHGLGIEMSRDDDRPAGLAGTSSNDVPHGDGSGGCLVGKGIEGDLATKVLELRFDVSL